MCLFLVRVSLAVRRRLRPCAIVCICALTLLAPPINVTPISPLVYPSPSIEQLYYVTAEDFDGDTELKVSCLISLSARPKRATGHIVCPPNFQANASLLPIRSYPSHVEGTFFPTIWYVGLELIHSESTCTFVCTIYNVPHGCPVPDVRPVLLLPVFPDRVGTGGRAHLARRIVCYGRLGAQEGSPCQGVVSGRVML